MKEMMKELHWFDYTVIILLILSSVLLLVIINFSVRDFMQERFKSSFCAKCKSFGGHVYATASNEVPLNSVLNHLYRTYASSPVRVPLFIAKFIRKAMFLER